MPKIKGQENQRYTEIFVDEWGREYLANCEMKTGDPIDLKVYNWTAPLEPAWARGLFLPPLDDHDVVTMVPRVQRNKKGFQILIDHRAWVAKRDNQEAQWKERITTLARESFKGADLMKVMDGDYPIELLNYAGPPPFPPREFILAMAAGNEWALGLSPIIPERALAVLERIKPHVEAQRLIGSRGGVILDPFASDTPVGAFDEDDDEPKPFAEDPFGPGGASLDKLEDLEDQYDPQATGGKRVPVGAGRGKRGRE